MSDAKCKLRREIRSLRESMGPDEVKDRSAIIISRLLTFPDIFGHSTYGLYAPTRNEVEVGPFAEELLRRGKTVLFPKTFSSSPLMEFHPVCSLEELQPARYGILEPQGGGAADPGSIDVLVIPGVAFDPEGHRLGFGGGYYDRFLPLTRPDALRIAVAFDFQVLESLPADRHDETVCSIVTESRILNPGR